MRRIAFSSVGCKLNRYEIQVMSESLGRYDFVTVPFSQVADCYVINTCSVTGDADLSSRQLIRRARRRNPDARVIATGCYAQLRPDDLNETGADIIIPNGDKDKLPEIVLKLFNIPMKDTFEKALISRMDGMTRAFVKIQDGCDDQCAFCTIWIARGEVRSRPIYEIIEEINSLSANGYKEVALTGVHIGKYSFESINFVGLLENLLEKTTIDRIRLSSLNPTEVTFELIALVKINSRICRHIHLSLQSGDDNVLRSMGRNYSPVQIRDVVDQLIYEVPEITVGADFIVGFPGESLEAFENTKRLIETGNLHHLHIFPYSDRPGTKASAMAEKISSEEKARRTGILRSLGRANKQKHLQSFVGRKLEVLFENRELADHKIMSGLSANYLRVDAPLVKPLLGKIVEVVPDEITGDHLITKIISGPDPGKKGLTLGGNENKFGEPLKSGLNP